MNFLSRMFSETVVAVVLIVFLVWFVNPFDFFMTDAFHMTLLGVIVACFAVFAMFLWKESCRDEREQLHRFVAARFASITVGGALLSGTIVQAFHHAIDPWLPMSLAIMVFAKILGRLYAERRF